MASQYVDEIVTMETSLNEVDPLTWQNGPDQLIPTTRIHTDTLHLPVKIDLRDGDLKKYPPMSIYTMFKRTVDKRPDHVALCFKKNNQWVRLTFLEYWKITQKAAKSFIKVNAPHDHVPFKIKLN
jgi:hypothetical protein